MRECTSARWLQGRRYHQEPPHHPPKIHPSPDHLHPEPRLEKEVEIAWIEGEAVPRSSSEADCPFPPEKWERFVAVAVVELVDVAEPSTSPVAVGSYVVDGSFAVEP